MKTATKVKINDFKVRPFIKWVGGKSQLISQLELHFPSSFNHYHEPFLGGGAVFFHLKSQGRIKKAFLSDYSPKLIRCYRQIKENPEKVIKKLDEYKKRHSKENYYLVRSSFNSERLGPVSSAAAFIYLNKTCFNGLYRENKAGKFNVPSGNHVNPSIYHTDHLMNVSESLQSSTLYTASFEDVLNNAKKGDFVYFDPPYYPVNSISNFTGYTSDGFFEEAHEKLAEVSNILVSKGCLVVQSNSDTSYIHKLYGSSEMASRFRIESVLAPRKVNSIASKRGHVKEVVIVSKNF